MRCPAVAVLVISTFAANGAFAASTAVANSDNCKVVRLKPGETPPIGGGMPTTIAGNAQVSGQTTTGNGVSAQSSSGIGTSVATSSNGRTTTVTSANGNCTVYVQPTK